MIDVSIPPIITRQMSLWRRVPVIAGSSLPVGGKSTHCILSAHRGLPSAKLFTDLNLVEEGDVFTCGMCWVRRLPQGIRFYRSSGADRLGITDGDDHVTLVTCTPYAVNTHRLLGEGQSLMKLREGGSES